MESKPTALGFSDNGKAYFLINYDLTNTTGCVNVNGMVGWYWCKFNRIIKI